MPGTPELFTLHVTDSELTEFLDLVRLSKIGPSTYWNQHTDDGRFGISREWLVNAKETWLSEFNWRAHEDAINSVPNFKINLRDPEAGEVSIHFAALFSKRDDAVPILFLHGYPGSFLEFLPMMQLLAQKYTPETLPYHVIVPSLPDYGLSGGVGDQLEMSIERAARIMNQLMVELGFGDGYVAQGGDLGSMLARILSVEYEGCKALHVNMLHLNPGETPSPAASNNLSRDEEEHIKRSNAWQQTGFAYALEHATRPSTIGLVISTNPLALLGWIGEKYLEWTDPRHPLPLDTILATVTLYWFTSTFPRSLYHASLAKNVLAGIPHPITKSKPLGYSVFPYDMAFVPRAWARELYGNLVAYQRHEQGGHFGALEQPAALLSDVEEFVGMVRDNVWKGQ
ncbi:epoxide hydrolase family protein [Aspergillus mulundensis]|uniref:Epoxide hydrolase N-terminal domain-containing protein n=1 Tax=Aspergillus mulundensis TaxID=1810919 RepID=A0A3D8T376_9EURO|nr:Uncharacterized protein DSM5745_00326 [Aspergillus mulundensis]RDW93004.1 Uncharacterized protein DSM5745_00326 [Aspergillus mulundensis]